MKYDYNTIKGALKEVQQTHHWVITFTSGDLKGLSTLVQSTGVPAADVAHTQVQLGGHTFNFAGKVTKSGTISVTMVENTDADVMTKLMTFYEKYFSGFKGNASTSTQGKQNYATNLHVQIKLDLLDGMDEIKQTWYLEDCIFTFEAGADLGQDAAAMLPALTITYNDFHWEKGKKSGA